MINLLNKKRIVLGVTGSIASYKAVDLASKLTQAGAQVDTILTQSATRFVTPLTFQSVTGRLAYSDNDLWGAQAHVLHVGLAHQADMLVIAPTTTNTLAKLAHGFSDNLLTVTALAANCPLLLAPAMDGDMFGHPATQENLQILREHGATIIGPEEGHLASGLVAKGRLTEPQALLGEIRHRLSRQGPLAGRKIVVTAGGTREAIDPIRYLTNRSSGKQGFALAQAALDLGGDVMLITTSPLPTPTGARRIDVDSTEEMLAAVLRESVDADALLMAAALADFRPEAVASQKIKKKDGMSTLALTNNPDVLLHVKEQRQRVGYPLLTIGFAAETENLRQNALSKLQSKGLDLIALNDVSATDAGFAVPNNRVLLLGRDGQVVELPLMSKEAVGAHLLNYVAEELSKR